MLTAQECTNTAESYRRIASVQRHNRTRYNEAGLTHLAKDAESQAVISEDLAAHYERLARQRRTP